MDTSNGYEVIAYIGNAKPVTVAWFMYLTECEEYIERTVDYYTAHHESATLYAEHKGKIVLYESNL